MRQKLLVLLSDPFVTPKEKEKNYELAKVLLAEQNFKFALISGSVSTVLSAGIYAVIAVAAGYAISYAALGIGAIVGFTIQYLGRGVESKFAVLASVLAVVGCVLGNVFSVILLEARVYGEWPFRIGSQISLDSLFELVTKTLHPADLIFWLLAIGAASYFAKRRLTREEGLAIYTYENRPKQNGIVT